MNMNPLSKRNFRNMCFIGIFATILTGCATPAQVINMTTSADPKLQAQPNSLFYKNIAVVSVSGGSETDPMGTSKVSSKDFKLALENSLQAAGLLGPRDKARYHLTAQLVSLNQPDKGYNMTVRTTVDYLLEDQFTRADVFDETIESSFTATVDDASAGFERLKIANEGSIKRSIYLLLKKINKLKNEKNNARF